MNPNGRPTQKHECPDCHSQDTLVTAGNSKHQKGFQYRRHLCNACGNKWSSRDGYPYYPHGREPSASAIAPKIVPEIPEKRKVEHGLTWTIQPKPKEPKTLRWTNEMPVDAPPVRL